MSKKTEKVAIFIDGSNLYNRLKDNIGFQNICFYEFAKEIISKTKLIIEK